MRYPFVSALLVLIATPAFAQVIYEPIQYQYGNQNHFYYGGSDPRIIRYAASTMSTGGTWGRINGFDFVSGNVHTHREVNDEAPRIYTDAMGYQNARYYGFNASDARNEAYANAPTYFRKRDLLNAAVYVNGVWVVPAQAQPISTPMIRMTPTTRPSARPVMVIPKKQSSPTVAQS